MLNSLLTSDEFNQIPESIRCKIQSAFNENTDQYLMVKASHETYKRQQEELVKDLKLKLDKELETCKSVQQTFDCDRQRIQALESKITFLQKENTELNESVERYENEIRLLRRERDEAVDEKISLQAMVTRRTNELENIKLDYDALDKKLKESLQAKVEALTNSDQIQVKQTELDLELKRTQQVKEMYLDRLRSFDENYAKQTNEMMRLRTEHSRILIDLQSQLMQKTNEIKVLSNNEESMKRTIEQLTDRIDNMKDRLSGHSKEEEKVHQGYIEEIECKTKLADLYKQMSEEESVKVKELVATVNELRTLLNESSTRCEELQCELEDKDIDFENNRKETRDIIQSLNKELQHANELINTLKNENTAAALDNLSPHAAAAYNLIKKGLTLTQIYAEFANVSEQLAIKTRENEQLNDYVQSILEQLEAKVPILKKKHEDYEEAMATVERITKSFDDLEVEHAALKEKYNEAEKNSSFSTRENQRLKKTVFDLSRQVCFLLKEVEESRGGEVPMNTSTEYIQSTSPSGILTSEDVIGKNLVTFHDIQELQASNQKLLSVVREVSAAYEAAEKQLKSCNKEELENKIRMLEDSVQERKEANERHNKVVVMLKNQLKMYQMMYNQQIATSESGNRKRNSKRLIPNSDNNEVCVNMNFDLDFEMYSGQDVVHAAIQTDVVKDTQYIANLKEELKKANEEIEEITQEYEGFKNEHAINEKMLMQSLDVAEKNASKLSHKCAALLARAEISEERVKSVQVNSDALKIQITALEDKCNVYLSTINKLEETVQMLRGESMQLHNTMSQLQVDLNNAQRECTFLRDSNKSIVNESNLLRCDKKTHENLLFNIESIKASIERSELESKSKMENKLDISMKECSALRRRLQEEQDRYREKAAYLKSTTDASIKRLEEEKKENEKLTTLVNSLKKDAEERIKVIENLNEKLKSSSLKSIYDLEMKIVHLQKELTSKSDEINNLKEMLNMAKSDAKETAELSEKFEKQLVTETENFNKYKSQMETKVSELAGQAAGLRQQNKKLTERLTELDGLKQTSMLSLNDELRDAKKTLTALSEEMTALKQQVHSLETELKDTTDAKLAAEKRYADEMLLHTIDVKELGKQTERIIEMENKIATLTNEKNSALEKATLSSTKWIEEESEMKTRLEEQSKRMKDLITQNELLYKQIQELGMKMSVAQSQSSIDESVSLSGDSQENYIQLIQYLRREKNIAVSEKDALKSENMRLESEIALTKSQLQETRKLLNAEQDKTDVSNLTTVKHAELLQKVETLSAITDSNRMLREERNKLHRDLIELKEKLDKIEIDTINPLKQENKQLTTQLEAITTENTALQKECIRWRNRVTELTDKMNKNNLEEVMKSLNMERENHNKTLDDLRAVKQEKSRFEDQLKKLQSNTAERLISLEKERSELHKELESAKLNYVNISQEFEELKKTFSAQETATNEMRTSNAQLRLIAKKYKIQYTDLLKTTEEDKKKIELAANTNNTSVTDTAPVPAEMSADEQERLRQEGRKQMEAELAEHVKQAAEKQRTLDTLLEENKSLQADVVAKENRCKELLRQSRVRISSLSAQSKKLEAEADSYKRQMLKIESILKDEHAARENVLKSSYENRISKLEKEKADVQAEKDRLNKEIESMNQRIVALQRTQQGVKLVANTGQEKSAIEPPTANIKPMAGPSSSSTKSQPSQQSVTVTPWRSISSVNDTPLASIRPMSMQARTVAVLPTSQTTCNVSQSTVVVPPQQQLVDTSSSAPSIVEAFSSSPSSSSHTDYNMPSTSSGVGHAPVRQMVVTPTQQASHSAESTQDMDPDFSALDMQTQTTVSVQQPVIPVSQNVSMTLPQMITATVSQSQAPTVALVSPRIESQNVPVQSQSHTISNIDQSVVASSQQIVISVVSASNQSEQSTSTSSAIQKRPDTCYQQENDDSNPGLVSASNQPSSNSHLQHVASSIETAPEQSIIVASSHQSTSSPSCSESGAKVVVEPSVVVASSNANSSNTVTTTQAGLKRQRETEGETSKSSTCTSDSPGTIPQIKRGRIVTHDDPFRGEIEDSTSDILLRCSGLDVEYQVPTSSQRDQEYDSALMMDSEGEELEDEQTMPDDGMIEFDEEDVDNDENGYELEGYDRDEQDMSMRSYNNVIELDVVGDSTQPDQDNEAEIMDEESNEVPNQSGNAENSSLMAVRSSIYEQSSEATSSGNNSRAESTNVSGNLLNQFGRRPSAISPLNRQQTQTLVLSQGFEDSTGDDSIVPSTPTLFVPRRSDGFSEAVSSPHVPSVPRFTFSESTTPNNLRAGLAQVVSEGMDDTRMDLSQLDDNNRTGRSVPSTPLQLSRPDLEDGEIDQSEGNDQLIMDQPLIEQPDGCDEDMAPVQPAESEFEELDGAGLNLMIDEQIEAADRSDPLEETNGVSSEGSQQNVPGGSSNKSEDEGREAEAVAENRFVSQQRQIPTTGTARRSTRLTVRTRNNTRTNNWDTSSDPARNVTQRGRGADAVRGAYRGNRARRPRSWGYGKY